MKRALSAGILLLAAMIYAWRDRAPEPVTTLPGPDDTITPVFPDVPAGEPITTTRPAPRPGRLRWKCGTSLRFEDASLRAVLKSKAQDDELFGQRVLGMEAAECGARRQRLGGQVSEGSVGIPPRRA